MKEDFLHYIWKYQLFAKKQLQTVDNKTIQVISVGIHNLLEGPDFFNAKLQIGSQLWVGTIEIHTKSSDWYAHCHQEDTNYNSVILHVIWDHDMEVFGMDNLPLPTLELKKFVEEDLLINYQKLFTAKQKWIPCQDLISDINRFFINHWLEALYVQRLERKSLEIFRLLKESKNDWEAVLFQLLAKNFGLKINGDIFLQWAKRIPFKLVRKERTDITKLSALFFGQANLLQSSIEDAYYQSLQQEYEYQKNKYRLKYWESTRFRFYGMRPVNFPTLRMAQLAQLYNLHNHLFSKVIAIKRIEQAYCLFDFELDDFWLTHYTFSKVSPKRKKSISHSFVNLLLINTLIPIQFAYAQLQNITINSNIDFELLRELPAEKNSIINKFSDLGVCASNALESQALLRLKNTYCEKKRCLQCAIGIQLLKQ